MWGERGLISHKFEGTGEGGAGGCPMSQAGSWGWTMVVQLAVARWARLSAGRVLNGHAAGGCPMGQAVSWAGAQWACSWRLPDGPGCQLGGCSMGVQLAVARWARLSTGHAMAIPARCRGCRTRTICRRDLFLIQNYDKGKQCCSNYIYIFRYHISTELYMRISKA